MSSPDEQFDDAYGDERPSLADPSRGLIQWVENSDYWFKQRYANAFLAEQLTAAIQYALARYGPKLTCAHCGIESTAPERHLCQEAILDWVWAEIEPRPIDNERLAKQLRLRQAGLMS